MVPQVALSTPRHRPLKRAGPSHFPSPPDYGTLSVPSIHLASSHFSAFYAPFLSPPLSPPSLYLHSVYSVPSVVILFSSSLLCFLCVFVPFVVNLFRPFRGSNSSSSFAFSAPSRAPSSLPSSLFSFVRLVPLVANLFFPSSSLFRLFRPFRGYPLLFLSFLFSLCFLCPLWLISSCPLFRPLRPSRPFRPSLLFPASYPPSPPQKTQQPALIL